MSVFFDISAALDDRLKNMVGLPPVAWANVNFEPTKGTLFLDPTLLPSDTVQASLGDNGQDLNVGLYQINVFAPSGEGKNEAMVMADKIADHFKRGTDLVYNNRAVRIKSVSQSVSTVTTEGWFMIPVQISYISFTEARI